ncbi:hypothetical protein [Thiobacillus sp.]|uniref:hypothetical protein n=1 Tax=Thiobacillus sp. TaxID=924 RepID=UPI0025FB31AD|nr:hypothetical protein [Thiobacillus sp.]
MKHSYQSSRACLFITYTAMNKPDRLPDKKHPRSAPPRAAIFLLPDDSGTRSSGLRKKASNRKP